MGGGSPALSRMYLERWDIGTGAITVDLIHGALQGHSLLGQALEVLGALLGLFMILAQLQGVRVAQAGSGQGWWSPQTQLHPKAPAVAHLSLVDGVAFLLVLQS